MAAAVLVAPQAPRPSLREMHADPDARTLDWFGAYSCDLPAPLDAQARQIGNFLFTEHKPHAVKVEGLQISALRAGAHTRQGHWV